MPSLPGPRRTQALRNSQTPVGPRFQKAPGCLSRRITSSYGGLRRRYRSPRERRNQIPRVRNGSAPVESAASHLAVESEGIVFPLQYEVWTSKAAQSFASVLKFL